MITYLDCGFGYPDPFDDVTPPTTPYTPPPLRFNESRDIEALRKLSTWLVVMRVVIVHSDLEGVVRTGLFGMLGDARVQVIDVCEEDKVEAFLSLAETCEHKSNVTVAQDFSRESVDSMMQKLRASVQKGYYSESLASELHLRPAIMFRLCTRMCNHEGLARPWPISA